MPFICEVDEDNLSYEFKSTVDRSMSENTMSDWLRIIMETLREIREEYDYTISHQQKIAGQTRHSLTTKLDHLFNGLLVLQRMMHENIPNQLNRSLSLKPRIPILYNLNTFHSSGSLKEKDLNSIINLDQAINDKLLPVIKELLIKYKKLVNPENEATIADFLSIFNVFDEIFYQLLIIRHNMVNCIIDD